MANALAPSISWTDRNRDILLTVTHKVRYLTPHQAARAWWSNTDAGIRNARRSLSRLAGAGYLDSRRATAHPELALDAPVLVWSPGDSEPAFGAVAYQLQKRWTEPVRSLTVYTATRLAMSHFGAPAKPLKHRLQATHDIHMTTVYLHLRATDPAAAESWRGEDLLPAGDRRGEKKPDAVLQDNGRVYRVIEFGGEYDADRVRRFHAYWVGQGMPYELW